MIDLCKELDSEIVLTESSVGKGRIKHIFEDGELTFAEIRDILTKVFSEIVEDFEGEVEAAREEYSKCENKIVAVLAAGKTKDGKNNITKVQIGANANNIASNRIIVKNGGILFRSTGIKNFYRIEL